MWPFKRQIKVSIDPKDEVEVANMQFDADVKVWRCRGLIMPAYPTWELVGREGSNCGLLFMSLEKERGGLILGSAL